MTEHISFARLVGTTIKHYRLEQLVQQQQHVALFLARYTKVGANPVPTEQIYQLRLFPLPEKITAQERLILLGQVQQEMSRIAALQHPVIQPILEYGHEQGMMYLVTPFIPTSYDLANVLSTQGPLDVIETGHNLELLVSALEYAHKCAITHGNLTASSVFLLPSSDSHPPIEQAHRLLLTDIGIAHLQTLLKCGGKPRINGNGVSQRGEQLLGQAPVNSDISALGALLYQMLTAHDAFAARGQEPGRQSQLPPLKVWRQGLPTELDAVISTAVGTGLTPVRVSTTPARSYRSLNELVDAYYQVVRPKAVGVEQAQETGLARGTGSAVACGSAQGTGQRPALSAPTAPQVCTIPTVPLTRRKLTVVLAAMGAGAVVVGGGWLFLRSQWGSQVAEGSTPVPQATIPPQNHATPRATSVQEPTNSGKVIARTADLPVNDATTFVIPNSNSENPGVLIHLPGNHFVAFDSTCTHQGCRVSYNAKTQQLECPCHGAVFDPTKDAAVVAGPAPVPLVPINIYINTDGTIVVVG